MLRDGFTNREPIARRKRSDMTDCFDKKTRSRVMSSIGAKNTKPELVLRRALHRLGYRYRLHIKRLPGTPDIVLTKYRAVVFVHGCFWHCHEGCRFAAIPKSNQTFWETKLSRNIERDRLVQSQLVDLGWRVGIVWGCELKRRGADSVARTVADWLESQKGFLELP